MADPNWPLSSADIQNIIAGALGGAVRGAALKLPWGEAAIAVFVGGACAKYLYPLGNAIVDPIISRITSGPDQSAGLGGFVIGVLGLALVGALMDIFKQRFRGQGREPPP